MTGFPTAPLIRRAGVRAAYRDAWGGRRHAVPEVVAAVMAALGLPIDTPAAVEASRRRLIARRWHRVLPPVVMAVEDVAGAVSVPLTLAATRSGVVLSWTLRAETGETRSGSVRVDSLPVIAARRIDGIRHETRRFVLPVAPPLGYHDVALDGLGDHPGTTTRLIVVPAVAFLPPGLVEGARRWGFSIQLYGLRSARNFGVGDFSDLAAFAEASARLGAAVVGLNPLHQRFPANPAHASPYAPSHRAFLDTAAIDPAAIDGFAGAAEIDAIRADPAFRATLARARAADLVDYPAVSKLKRPLFEALHRAFRASGDGAARPAFEAFRRSGGASLETYCRYEVLAERFADRGGWPAWPEPFHDPAAAAARAVATEAPESVEFYAWLQWQADRQLARAAKCAAASGMVPGLYRDLALGADGGGAETWANRALIATGASLGAPPDDWNRLGQDWGLPPYGPQALRDAAYAPFIETVRANMRHAGALRVDHVMSLLRLYWIPRGARADEGCYVRYRFDELAGIVALESRRARTMVVGEDLGTVPRGFRERLARAGILSYRLLFFEQEAPSVYRKPTHYPRQATVTVSTHDLATLAAWWRGEDIVLRATLGLFPDAETAARILDQRWRDRSGLIEALRREALIGPHEPEDDALTPSVMRAVHLFLARTPSMLMSVHLGDILGETAQINVPGTTDQHPNWRRKFEPAVETLESDESVRRVAAEIGATRAE
ncbi:MAG: 4-alpha-glucanotransferase [Alphaproteobacteria bacterium]|nr:4-alpha-glucanotransferase [Alphaproteobacteria bacterium]